MTILKVARSACAATCALALISTGTALAAPYVGEITATQNGEVIGTTEFTFDPEVATVINRPLGDGTTEDLSVYGYIEDLTLPIGTLFGEQFWLGNDPQNPSFTALDTSGLRNGFDAQPSWWVFSDSSDYMSATFSYGLSFDAVQDSFVAVVMADGQAAPQFDGLTFTVTLAEAVPLPSAALFLLTGLSGVAGARRFSRRN
ncbi:VPLPA-CTERM sorting domain-containing protein [Parvularcula oceani]|uniref:VPLPA-CTERM sorting domain-containing protein n=1 Tax=Parvularcula oceani TaxID=1247963 RepID=UPI0004E1B6C0|nr:VPLPA-CTERM sorting domain-containing protein [Parvularcula oceani]